MVKNITIQPKDIYKDPYGYTYSEMEIVLGEIEAGCRLLEAAGFDE